MIRNLIFDLDGTILNTITDLTDAGNKTCLYYGWKTYNEKEFKEFVGHSVRGVVEKIIPKELFTEDLAAEVNDRYRRYYIETGNKKTKPYTGIPELLTALKKCGLEMAVLSNKPQDALNLIICRFYPDLFKACEGAKPEYPIKPDPAHTNRLLSSLGFKHDETLYVGDSDTDVFTAHNANLVCCGVTWGYRGEDLLRKYGADYLAHTPEELKQIIESLRS